MKIDRVTKRDPRPWFTAGPSQRERWAKIAAALMIVSTDPECSLCLGTGVHPRGREPNTFAKCRCSRPMKPEDVR